MNDGTSPKRALSIYDGRLIEGLEYFKLLEIWRHPESFGLRPMRASKCPCLSCKHRKLSLFRCEDGSLSAVAYVPEFCGLAEEPGEPVMIVEKWCRVWISKRIPSNCTNWKAEKGGSK